MAGLRIGGLASGMDIDQIVGDLMRAQRMPLNKLKQKKQVLEWRRDDYRSMNSLLLNFRTELTNMKLTSTYRARSVTSTNEALVSATASSAASKASYSIQSVTSLATAATKVSTNSISTTGTKIDATQSIYSQQANMTGGAGVTWLDGAVNSQTFQADGILKEFTIGLKTGENIDTLAAANMQVKVNGKSYDIITTPGAVPNANQVLLESNGKLTFSDIVPKDSTIKVDYIMDKRIETNTLAIGTNEWQLGNTLLKNFSMAVTSGGTTTKYDPIGSPDINGYTSLEVAGDPTKKIGKINLNTGKVIFEPPLAEDSEVNASYTQMYTPFTLISETSKGELKEKFLITASESLNQVINRVNNANVGVTMFYDSFADKVSLTRTETGDFLYSGQLSDAASGTINQISATGDFLEELLQFSSTESSNGTNSVFTINGMTTSRSTNTFEMNGVTFTLKNTFNDPLRPVSLSVNNDSNQVFNNIKTFVDKYNELIDKLQKKSSEEYYRSYQPLTDEQRETLSDKQQEQWEEKAKSGLLRRDPILSQVLSEMRSDFYTPVDNLEVNPNFKQLASIGITTSSNYLEGGKLTINETKLRKAIEDDPTSVEKLFNVEGSTDSQNGLIHRLYDSVNETMEKLKGRAGNSFSTNQQFALGKELLNIDSQINRFESRLIQIEDRYWRQFTAMEKAIQRNNSQSMYLMQQFSGGM